MTTSIKASSDCPLCGFSSPHNHDADIPEWEAALRRAFVGNAMKSISLDGWCGKFLWRAALYGQFKGWLTDGTEHGSDEAQYTWISLSLTEVGRQYFGLGLP